MVRHRAARPPKRTAPFYLWITVVYLAVSGNCLRAFMKDVRTLAVRGELAETLSAIQELSQLTDPADWQAA